MLYDSVASSHTDQHYQELIMKCTWKTIKYIPEWNVDLDYNKVLTEIHRFLNVRVYTSQYEMSSIRVKCESVELKCFSFL